MNQVYRESNKIKTWKFSSKDEFRYRTVVNRHLLANKSLYQNEEMLARFGFPLTNFTVGEALSQFVFVTAADRAHFHESMDGIASIQDLFPNKPIYFYDLTNGFLRSKVHKVNQTVDIFVYFYCSLCTTWQQKERTFMAHWSTSVPQFQFKHMCASNVSYPYLRFNAKLNSIPSYPYFMLQLLPKHKHA